MHRLSLKRVNELFLATRDPRALALLNRLALSEFATDQDVVLFERHEHSTMEKASNVRYLSDYRRRYATRANT